jgi:hypothetical protein
LGKPLKFLKTKLNILELCQNKFENPQTIPPTLFSPCETSKMTRKKLKIPEFQNTKTKNFQNSHEEEHIPHFLACEKLHTKNLKTPKMTKKKLKNLKFQNTKTKDLQNFQKKIKYPISPL